MLEPTRALREHFADVGAGEGRGGVAEVADVEALRTAEAVVRLEALLDPEGEVAPALEDEHRRLDRGERRPNGPRGRVGLYAGEVRAVERVSLDRKECGMGAACPPRVEGLGNGGGPPPALRRQRLKDVVPPLDGLPR